MYASDGTSGAAAMTANIGDGARRTSHANGRLVTARRSVALHSDADQVLSLDKTSKRLPGLIKNVQLTVVESGPHAIPWTHADQVNTALLDFIRS
jgi:pimeloyl-ACP methyl ester carboxylesterase